MDGKIIKHFYEEIKFLAEKIGELELPEKLIEEAKNKNFNKYREVFDKFKEENPELKERLAKLYGDYALEYQPEIFLDRKEPSEDDVNLFIYDSSDINPLNLIIIMMFSGGVLHETCIFKDTRDLHDAIINIDQKELADYMEDNFIENYNDIFEAYKY